jgi:SAM-dependent methyltransferase
LAHRYVHGYTTRESLRLQEQSAILEPILHSDTAFPAESRVLEAGCGVGAQSRILSGKSPDTRFTAVDISGDSLNQAKCLDLPNFTFTQADIFKLPFEDGSFDHVFVCFVLEHLNEPVLALSELRRVLRPNGTLVLIEGDHGSCFWHPETELSLRVWNALVTVQSQMGHDPNIGRRIHPLLAKAGFSVMSARPCWLYADAGSSQLLDGMVNHIIVPMVKTVRETAVPRFMNPSDWDRGITELEASGDPPEGTFFYTWFKAVARK